jgi:hypothetical protein
VPVLLLLLQVRLGRVRSPRLVEMVRLETGLLMVVVIVWHWSVHAPVWMLLLLLSRRLCCLLLRLKLALRHSSVSVKI